MAKTLLPDKAECVGRKIKTFGLGLSVSGLKGHGIIFLY